MDKFYKKNRKKLLKKMEELKKIMKKEIITLTQSLKKDEVSRGFSK